ncbi:outer membrane lipoprotein-sorting protein [Paraglaciecola arctica]|uniref:outer membrane lipoprotein-sorting protein n=1 Tax=Paraglaciecola arctica TaxID=1128911 RepID=UPI001C071620|nr:outer membrane lipoprotein-sorting protein [Paraglaciecola arctica]MBU3005496.1 outer membrane lipoprotein-sorting protein [Paraglaciecola arctica]
MNKNLLSSSTIFTLVFALLTYSVSSYAQSPQEKGLEIAKERKLRDQGWGDSTGNMSMILRNAQGDEVERKMRLKSLELVDDGDKGMTIFDQPLDVKGTVFLNFTHASEPDDQWMYLPKLSKVKRIRSRNKSGPFMGSEFAFEDMSSFEIEKYEFKYLRDETYEGQASFVLEQVPTDKNSGYSKQIVWVDKEHYRALKIEFYDRKGSLLKELVNLDFALYLDKYWRPMRVEMFNEQNGKSTELITHELNFDTGLTDNDFNKGTLKNVR